MRILVVSPHLPWPILSGGSAAQFSTLRCLMSDHEFTLVCPVYSARQMEQAQHLAKELPDVRVRAVYSGLQPMSPGLGRKLLRRIVRFAQQRLEPPSSLVLPDNPFYRLPAQVLEAVKEELDAGTDLCQAEFVDTMILGAWLPRELPKLFIHHQVHFVYANRFGETHRVQAAGSCLAEAMRIQEIACLEQFDGVVTFSETDRQALLPHLPADKVFASPFPIPSDVGIAKDLPESFDGRFLFLASESHDPNRDALNWLMTEIWPKIRLKLPEARLVVIGQWGRETVASFSGANVTFSGFVEDLGATLRGGIMLVPLRIGSGIRVKILVAAAQGAPVVTTPVGVEGLQVRDGHEVLICEEPEAFAAATVRLARDPALWRRLAAAARDSVVKNYSPDEVRKRRNEIYARVTERTRPLSSSARAVPVAV